MPLYMDFHKIVCKVFLGYRLQQGFTCLENNLVELNR